MTMDLPPAEIPPGVPCPMKTLTLDLGTDIGWAVIDDSKPLQSGTLRLASRHELEDQQREGKDRTLDIRLVRFYRFVEKQVLQAVIRIVFEDVGFVSSRMQTQLWASLRTAIWMVALMHPEVSVFAIPVATLKQFATGNIHATKPDMARALAAKLPNDYRLTEQNAIRKADGSIANDDEVDAIWLAYYTCAVDEGHVTFLTAHQRKMRALQERRLRKQERRQRAKAKRAAARLKREAVKDAIRNLGRCCGVFRQQHRRWAVCPRCGSAVALPRFPDANVKIQLAQDQQQSSFYQEETPPRGVEPEHRNS